MKRNARKKLYKILPDNAVIILSDNTCWIETDYHSPIQVLHYYNCLEKGFGLLLTTIQNEIGVLSRSEFTDPSFPIVAWLDFTLFNANDGDIYHTENFILSELKKYTSLSEGLRKKRVKKPKICG